MTYVLAASAAIIALAIGIWALNVLRHLRADLEATVTWIRSSASDLDRLNQRLERTIDKADQSS